MQTLQLPKTLQRCTSLETNVKYDDYCFLYCIIRSVFKECEHLMNGQALKPYFEKFNLHGLSFPLQAEDIPKFLRQNEHYALTVCLFYYYDGRIFPLGQHRSSSNDQHCVDLLLFKTPLDQEHVDGDDDDDDDDEGVFSDLVHRRKRDVLRGYHHHFFKIKNRSAFLQKTYVNHYGERVGVSQKIICPRCFAAFKSPHQLKKHRDLCEKNKAQIVCYPDANDVVQFTQHKHKFFHPLIGVLDFECVLDKTAATTTTARDGCFVCQHPHCQCPSSRTVNLDQHKPVGYTFLLVDYLGNVVLEDIYEGEDAAHHFHQQLQHHETRLDDMLQKYRRPPQTLNPEDIARHAQATHCHICGQSLWVKSFGCDKLKLDKVWDHCHLTGTPWWAHACSLALSCVSLSLKDVLWEARTQPAI